MRGDRAALATSAYDPPRVIAVTAGVTAGAAAPLPTFSPPAPPSGVAAVAAAVAAAAMPACAPSPAGATTGTGVCSPGSGTDSRVPGLPVRSPHADAMDMDADPTVLLSPSDMLPESLEASRLA